MGIYDSSLFGFNLQPGFVYVARREDTEEERRATDLS